MRDALTSLPSRKAFIASGTEVLRLSDCSNRAALHVIHIANVKPVIMEHGLLVGEAMLKAVGRRLYGVFQDGKVFARLGGDEFGLLQLGISHEGHALYTARRMFESLQDPVVVNGLQIPVEVRTGIALFPDHGRQLDKLFSCARDALSSMTADSQQVCAVYRQG